MDLYCQIASAVTRQADWAVVRYIGYRTNRRCHLKLVKRNLVSIFKQQFPSDLNFTFKNIVLNIDAILKCSAFDGTGCTQPTEQVALEFTGLDIQSSELFSHTCGRLQLAPTRVGQLKFNFSCPTLAATNCVVQGRLVFETFAG